MKPKRVAIIAEWMTSRGGAEKVVLALLEIFPKADIFTSVVNRNLFPELKNKKIRTSFLQTFPILNRKHQNLLPLLPTAMRSLNLKGYDLIISSSSAFGKGIKKPKGSTHICYCHTPIRYVWQPDIDKRLINLPLGNQIIKLLKKWDLNSNASVDYFISNSNYTRNRIEKYYRREATVIYPPVETRLAKSDKSKAARENFYFAISRLIPYKKLDLAVRAANELQRELIVAGVGSEFNKLTKLAGPTVKILGRITDPQKLIYYRKARAIIFPAEEDFGIVPIEALAAGCPVIAFSRGGARETVIDGKTGVLFDEQSIDSLKAAVLKFEKMHFSESIMLEHAESFSKERFLREISDFIKKIKS